MSSWLHELSGLVSAAVGEIPAVHGEIRIRSSEAVAGIELATGAITSGESASSELQADERVLRDLLSGKLSLQSVFRSGQAILTGEPEPFLFLAMLLEHQRSQDRALYS